MIMTKKFENPDIVEMLKEIKDEYEGVEWAEPLLEIVDKIKIKQVYMEYPEESEEPEYEIKSLDIVGEFDNIFFQLESIWDEDNQQYNNKVYTKNKDNKELLNEFMDSGDFITSYIYQLFNLE